MKYIIVLHIDKTGGRNLYWPVIFPDQMTHSSVAEGIGFSGYRDFDQKYELASAGFCFWDEETAEWACASGSESLKINKTKERDENDKTILNMPEAYGGNLDAFRLIPVPPRG